MSIRFECGICGKTYTVDDHLAGKTAKCKGCGEMLTIPSPQPQPHPQPQVKHAPTPTVSQAAPTPHRPAPAPVSKPPQQEEILDISRFEVKPKIVAPPPPPMPPQMPAQMPPPPSGYYQPPQRSVFARYKLPILIGSGALVVGVVVLAMVVNRKPKDESNTLAGGPNPNIPSYSPNSNPMANPDDVNPKYPTVIVRGSRFSGRNVSVNGVDYIIDGVPVEGAQVLDDKGNIYTYHANGAGRTTPPVRGGGIVPPPPRGGLNNVPDNTIVLPPAGGGLAGIPDDPVPVNPPMGGRVGGTNQTVTLPNGTTVRIDPQGNMIIGGGTNPNNTPPAAGGLAGVPDNTVVVPPAGGGTTVKPPAGGLAGVPDNTIVPPVGGNVAKPPLAGTDPTVIPSNPNPPVEPPKLIITENDHRLRLQKAGALLKLSPDTQDIQNVDLRTVRDFNAAIGVLAEMTTVPGLQLTADQITKDTLPKIQTLKHIDKLDLTNARISDDKVDLLAKFPQMEDLTLTGNPLTKACSKSLASLTNASKLVLTQTQIDDSACPSLAKLANLKTLDISATSITSAGIRQLKPLKELTSLKITNLDVSPAAVKELEKNLSKCNIIQ